MHAPIPRRYVNSKEISCILHAVAPARLTKKQVSYYKLETSLNAYQEAIRDVCNTRESALATSKLLK